ncbi:protein kinase domain protein [Ichthyophthirius multifiliis]|uniref:non-specific serine/threonine protein kinase n=1 Tax=Ichthyophthirius multifiliis TaxID=5932 RepID=G0QMP1_ICHMU|nr:protein kinase domain protein [Ichthyophthirius multifiliis]EGR33516.1 protein kinase domain protein [Ichthyophthirius multifiliis]|eukprot:XP_004037502.1 protein kinase domain protein [Ichthyophthirius multifiliis]
MIQNYKIHEKLGFGKFSDVHLCSKCDKKYAVKLYKEDTCYNQKEKKILGILDHPNIVTLVDFGDFGLSCQLNSDDILLNEIVGTQNYMPPEMINNKEYKGAEVDIFCVGVILFCFVYRFQPWIQQASGKDPLYGLLSSRNYGKYWDILGRKKHDPEKRITLDNIKTHEWTQGEICSQEEIIQQMSLRREIFIKKQQNI